MPHPISLLKTATRFLIPFITVLLITGFIACNSGTEKESSAGVSQTSGFQMNCVILEKSQVQAWVDSGWTKPKDESAIKGLVFQFYTGDATLADKNMQLIVYPGQNFTDVKTGGKTILKIDTTCTQKTLSGPVIFANNVIYLAALDIFNPDGSLKDFDFIRFVPSTAKFNPYINFNIEIVKAGAETKVLSGDGTEPCPPYCPPPPPPPPPPSDK